MTVNKKMNIRMVIDVLMTILLLCLMAYQITGEFLHEWIGVIMTFFVIVHQIINRKWYAALLKGKYNMYRLVTTLINLLLIVSFFLTAICGMSMSSHAVPLFYGILKISFSRSMHLAFSHWSFVLMGLHLGMHIPIILLSLKISDRAKQLIYALSSVLAGWGLY